MVTELTQLILWTGPKHSGKTSRVVELINTAQKEGFIAAGILALSLYKNNKLIGFDVLDVKNQNRQQLLRRSNIKTQSFTLISEGQQLGFNALNETAIEYADIVIVDEFGPFELNGNLWRKKVDSIVESGKLILLVVREELVREVRQIYSSFSCMEMAASESESITKVLNVLRDRQSLFLVSE